MSKLTYYLFTPISEGPCWHRDDGPPTKEERRLKEIDNVQKPTVAWARRNEIPATKLQGPGNRSQPDYIFWIPGGAPLLIEFKRPGTTPTPLQTHTYEQYMKLGYDVQVHDTKESAIQALKYRIKA